MSARSFFRRRVLLATLAMAGGLWVLFSGLACAMPPAFTAGEKAFIAAHPIVTYSDADCRPLSIIEDGRAQGLFHDYLELVSQRTGLVFRFEPQGDGRQVQPVLDALRTRRIDMVGGMDKAAARADYALAAGPFLRFPLAMLSRDDAPAYSLSSLTGRRVAVVKGGTAEAYLKEHGQDLTLVATDDHVQALTLVATNKADAAVADMAVAAYAIRSGGLANVKVTGLLDEPLAIVSLVRSDWPELASILTKAQASVTNAERAALLDKWLPVYRERLDGDSPNRASAAASAQAMSLTDRERSYLARKKTLTYCVDPDWAPIERIDENGRHVGMTADFLKLMSARLGVRMELVPTASWSQSLAAVKSRRCDFLPAAGNTRQRRRFLKFTGPYLRFPMVVATRANVGFIDDPGQMVGKPLGVINGYASLDLLRARYPSLRLMEVPSVDEGLRLVSEGKLFGYIDTVPAIGRAIARDHRSDLKIAGRLDAHLDLAVASRDDEPELNALFQKAVNSLTKEESDAILKKWLAVTFEQGFDYSLLWKVLAAAALIVAVVIWWNRKLSRLNRTIRQAHEELDRTHHRMTALLDNAGQGFLTVGAEGVVEPLCSQECRVIFGTDIAGAWFPAVLYPDDTLARETMAKNIRRILAEPDDYRRELYFSLMPKEAMRRGASLRLAYRALTADTLMFIVTDVSGEQRLRDAVDRERNRLACVVAAVRDERDFFAVLDAFAVFRGDGERQAAETPDARTALDGVYRQVHTFKGLFLQLECAQVATALDALESRLSVLRQAKTPVTGGAVAEVLADTAVDAALQGDLAVVREALGEAFFTRRGQICLSGEQVDALIRLARHLLDRADGLALDPQDLAVLRQATTLRHVDLKELLAGYPRTALRLAHRQGKELEPFVVTGDVVSVDPRQFDPLVKSLVHVFRNAVDHGLESPQERELAGKSVIGHMACRVRREAEAIVLEMRDDGRGIDPSSVRSRAFELGLGGAEELTAMDDREVLALLFRDGFTSRRQVGDLSGRGVGLAAVRVEAERLGGTVSMESTWGVGACVRVVLPLAPLGRTGEHA